VNLIRVKALVAPDGNRHFAELFEVTVDCWPGPPASFGAGFRYFSRSNRPQVTLDDRPARTALLSGPGSNQCHHSTTALQQGRCKCKPRGGSCRCRQRGRGRI